MAKFIRAYQSGDIDAIVDMLTDCFITTASPGETVGQLHAQRVAIEAGPVERNGALGAMTCVYCRDPDGNLLEIATYHSSRATWPPFGNSEESAS